MNADKSFPKVRLRYDMTWLANCSKSLKMIAFKGSEFTQEPFQNLFAVFVTDEDMAVAQNHLLNIVWKSVVSVPARSV